MVELVGMNQKLVLAGNIVGSNFLLLANGCTLHTFTRIFKRCDDQPTIFVLEYLMDAYLVAFTQVLETSVIDQVGKTVASSNDAIMALRAFAVVAYRLVAP